MKRDDQQPSFDRLTRVEDKVDLIMGNHLVHLDKKVDKVSDNVEIIIWLIISTLIGIIFLLIKVVK